MLLHLKQHKVILHLFLVLHQLLDNLLHLFLIINYQQLKYLVVFQQLQIYHLLLILYLILILLKSYQERLKLSLQLLHLIPFQYFLYLLLYLPMKFQL